VIERTTWVLETTLPASAVRAALIDFGPDRVRIFRETSHPAVYRVHHVGPSWAKVTEGIAFSWSRERYDWSDDDRVVLDQLASNVAIPGGRIAYTIVPTASGCQITCDRRRRFRRTPRGVVAGTIMRLFGPRILRRQFATSLERIAAA